MQVLDDDTVAPALRALTAGQPAQPADRLAAVTRRVRRIRRTRVAFSVAAVVAVITPAGMVAADRAKPTHRRVVAATATPRVTTATQPITTWPDRSQDAHRSVADGALKAWVDDNGPINDVRWLYRGTIVSPGSRDSYVAAFIADGDTMVVANTNRDLVDEHGVDVHGFTAGQSPWFIRSVPVASAPTHLGTYVRRMWSANTAPPPATTNTLVVLASPQARELRWTLRPLPYATVPSGVEVAADGRLQSSDGVFIGDAGALTGPLDITIVDDRGTASRANSLAVPVHDPSLVHPPAPDYPADWAPKGGMQAQSQRGADGRYGPDRVGATDSTGKDARRVVYVRCYGGGTLQVTLDTVDQTHRGQAACDGQSHRAVGPVVVPVGTTGYALEVLPDRLQSFNVLEVG